VSASSNISSRRQCVSAALFYKVTQSFAHSKQG
jgi:hypothetical protein